MYTLGDPHYLETFTELPSTAPHGSMLPPRDQLEWTYSIFGLSTAIFQYSTHLSPKPSIFWVHIWSGNTEWAYLTNTSGRYGASSELGVCLWKRIAIQELSLVVIFSVRGLHSFELGFLVIKRFFKKYDWEVSCFEWLNKKDLSLEIRSYSSTKYIIKKPERPMNSFMVSLFSCFKGRLATTKSKDHL